MLSRISAKWRWYDWLLLLIAVIVICTLIQLTLPETGLAKGLHQGFHALAIGLEWIAGGLTAAAGLLNQL